MITVTVCMCMCVCSSVRLGVQISSKDLLDLFKEDVCICSHYNYLIDDWCMHVSMYICMKKIPGQFLLTVSEIYRFRSLHTLVPALELRIVMP